MNFADYIRDIPNFPKEGIIFKDITPLLADPEALKAAVKAMAAGFSHANVDLVVGMESRGFIFGPAIAMELGCGFAPIRKPKKLPYQTYSESYDLEYGSDTLEIHTDAAYKDQRVLIVDDLIATGGTAQASGKLIERLGAQIAGYAFLIELTFLSGRQRLGNSHVHSILKYG